MFNFNMFKAKESGGNLVQEAMKNKTEEEQAKAKTRIDSLAFQKALIEIMDELSEEELDELEATAAGLGKEKFAEKIREEHPNFNVRFEEIKQELTANLESSLEEVDGINVDTAGRVGELAFRSAMNEVISEADDEDMDALNDIMESNKSLEEKMKFVSEKIPNFQEVLDKKSNETANDLDTLARMTMEKVAKLKKERGIE